MPRLTSPRQQLPLTGCRVLILVGAHAGEEGVCVGKSADGKKWAVSPDGSNEILQLKFEEEFGLLVTPPENPAKN